MKISIKQLQHHQCPKKPLHYKTAYVFFTERGAISTDGRKMIVVPYPEDEKTHDTPKSEKDAIAVHMDQCRIAVDFIRYISKSGEHHHTFEMQATPDSLTFIVKNQSLTLERHLIPSIDFASVLEAPRKTITKILVDPDFLSDLFLNVQRAAGTKEPVEIEITSEDNPENLGRIHITPKGNAGVSAVAMTVRS